MNREIPFHRGKKDKEKVDQIRNAGFSMACIPSFLIGLIIILVSLFLNNRLGPEYIIALRVIAVLVFLKQLYDFFTLVLRSDHNFKFLSKVQIFLAIVDITLVSVLVIRFGFYGFLWASVLTNVWIIGYIFYKTYPKYRFKLSINRKLLMSLAKTGILIMLIAAAVNLRTTVDRLMIVKFLGVKYLGYFSISYILIQFIFLIPSAISQIMYPRLAEKYGSSNKDTGAIRNYIEISTLVLAYFMPLLIGGAFIFLPIGIKLLLPQYIPGTIAAQITILGLFFFAVGIMAGNFLITTNRLYWYLKCSVIAVGFNLVLDYVFIKMGLGINGVALGGIMISSIVYTTLVLGSVMFHYLKSVSKTIIYLLKIYFPFFYTVVILFFLNYFKLHIMIQAPIFVMACLPLFVKLEKSTKVISFVFSVIKDYRRKGGGIAF